MDDGLDMSTIKLTWRNGALSLITLVVLYLCMRMFSPFLSAIVGAIVLASLTHRPYLWLLEKVNRPAYAASIATALVTLSIILPGIFLSQIFFNYAVIATNMLRNGTFPVSINDNLGRFPQLANTLRHSVEFLTLSRAAESLAGVFAKNLMTVLGNSMSTLTQTVIMLFILFFFYRDDRSAIRLIYSLLPLSETETDYLLTRIEETIRTTFLGNFVVAAIQGLLSGGVFAILGISNAAILGVLVTIAAIVPYFGAYVVWLPVAAYLGLTGHWVKMTILLAVGTLLISTLDNILYPIFVGNKLRQHPVSILLSLLGGVWLFGVTGLILGPVIFSIAETLVSIWQSRMSGSLLNTETQPEGNASQG